MADITAEIPPWFTLASNEFAGKLAVDPKRMLSSAEIDQRLQQHGPNVLSE